MKQYLKLMSGPSLKILLIQLTMKFPESVFSIGNGLYGATRQFRGTVQRSSLQGSYMAGVYYPDKTRVGWWKNGYPEYFAKVLNSTNWIGINVRINGVALDLAKCQVKDFVRELNMKEGYLSRSFTAKLLRTAKKLQVEAVRFVSITRHEIGAIRYSVTPLNFRATLLLPYLDGDVQNKDSNYDEKFWLEVEKSAEADLSHLTLKTKKLDFPRNFCDVF